MPSLAEFQAGFTHDLVRDQPPQSGPFARPAFAVYRNTWRKALREALRANYPVVAALIGEEVFHRLASEYIRKAAARSPILADYGAGLDETIAASQLHGMLPYLADMARLERLVTQARNAAAAEPIGPDFFATLAPDRAERVWLNPVPSAHLARFPTPVVTIWRAHQGPDQPKSLSPDWRNEQALIVQRGTAVAIDPLDRASFDFAAMLVAGNPLGVAATDTIARHPDADIAAILTRVARSGAFTINREDNP
ncbi:DUF2063 domain-containing protein [Parasphingopyxis algicola]|uniref:HvfC/BufC N-terminal domain-containing protein n=1 Tax=Parasphingopyxis algicola TaxID=2026624 RepID=UPI0015A175FF|nr:DNA-binding domain-containing protein [Parasphingopyxis algicola]QLC24735.1 DUF2063 domain-containing protein [Parasphingopyxis algicola]